MITLSIEYSNGMRFNRISFFNGLLIVVRLIGNSSRELPNGRVLRGLGLRTVVRLKTAVLLAPSVGQVCPEIPDQALRAGVSVQSGQHQVGQ